MRLSPMLKARLAHTFREPVFLVLIALSVAVSVSAALLVAEKQQPGFDVAVVSEDAGDLGGRLLAYLVGLSDFTAREMPKDKALRLLQNDRLDAVIVIRDNFSESLLSGEFRNTLELFTSPSSPAPATVSEPVINGAMMLWMEEFSTLRTRAYLYERGKEYGASDEERHRAEMSRLWEAGAAVFIEKVELNGVTAPVRDTSPLHACIKWYGAFSLFFLLHAASWVLEMNKSGLTERLRQADVPRWKMVVGNCLPALLVGLFGYLIAGTLVSALTGGRLYSLIPTLLPVALYLTALVGMTLFVASSFNSTLSLMFVAPVLTFLSAVMSGLFLDLPQWAYALVWLSHALPGKWLVRSLEEPLKFLPGALLCGAAWAAAGLAMSARDPRRANRRRRP